MKIGLPKINALTTPWNTAKFSDPVSQADQDAYESLPPDLQKLYYDRVADLQAQQRYYQNMTFKADYQGFTKLRKLISGTHRRELKYKPARDLFPWVDLRPSFRLQSLYTNQGIEIDAPLRVTSEQDYQETVPAQTAQGWRYTGRSLKDQAMQWLEALSQAPTDAARLGAKIAELETKTFLNCEHVIPQLWFDYDQPMKGDLHCLYTCETGANEFRSSLRFYDFEDYDPALGDEGGVSNERYFEPAAGKGEVARSIFYFRTRYPNQPLPYSTEDYQMFLRWHQEDPPTVHEFHRNREIQKIQGNRNPYIDHPEWAEQFVKYMGH